MINQAWQLAVVDYDRLKNFYEKNKKFARIVESSKSRDTSFKDGEVVYIASIMDTCKKIGEVDFSPQCRVWLPERNKYGYCILDMLYPILTEKNIIEVELKFGIKLDDYVQKV